MDRKVAIITGASTGIGAASALRLAQDGFDLTIASRTESKLDKVAEECRKEGADVLVVAGDMSKKEDVKAVFDKTIEHFGKLDFVFSNQGVLMEPTPFEEMTEDQFDLVAQNNFKSTFLMLIEATNAFKKLGTPGNVLATGSSSGIRPEAGFGVYSASKAAVIQLVKDAAIECGKLYNIRYNCLCPGGFTTPMTQVVTDVLTKDAIEGKDMGNLIRRSMPVLLPDRDLGDTSEIVGIVSMIASDASTYMQGSVISVDGGITL